MIELNGISKSYGKSFAIRNISFTVNDREILGFLGPNGAGKSTTMNIISGFLAPTSGSVTIDGLNIAENPYEAKKLIGYLPELPPLYEEMTVGEYLSFVYDLKRCKIPKKVHIKEICNLVKLTDVLENKRVIGHLSKGYRQRVGIAQALIGNPKMIILDEPTIGLDPTQIIEVRNLIKHLGKSHTVILSTHILSEVQSVCDRVVVINKGEVVANEKIEDLSLAVSGTRKLSVKIVGKEADVLKLLRAMPGIKNVVSMGKQDTDSISYSIESESNADIRKPLFALLAKNDMPIIGLESMESKLEDIFVRLVNKQNESGKAQKRLGGIN